MSCQDKSLATPRSLLILYHSCSAVHHRACNPNLTSHRYKSAVRFQKEFLIFPCVPWTDGNWKNKLFLVRWRNTQIPQADHHFFFVLVWKHFPQFQLYSDGTSVCNSQGPFLSSATNVDLLASRSILSSPPAKFKQNSLKQLCSSKHFLTPPQVLKMGLIQHVFM